MTDDPKFKDASEGQAPQTPEPKKPEPEATITLSLPPDGWSIDHYQIYADGQREYEIWARANKRAVDLVLKGFYGATALIRAQVVHVKVVGQADSGQLAKLNAYVERLKMPVVPGQKLAAVPGEWVDAPMALVGLLWREVAFHLEDSTTSPL